MPRVGDWISDESGDYSSLLFDILKYLDFELINLENIFKIFFLGDFFFNNKLCKLLKDNNIWSILF